MNKHMMLVQGLMILSMNTYVVAMEDDRGSNESSYGNIRELTDNMSGVHRERNYRRSFSASDLLDGENVGGRKVQSIKKVTVWGALEQG